MQKGTVGAHKSTGYVKPSEQEHSALPYSWMAQHCVILFVALGEDASACGLVR